MKTPNYKRCALVLKLIPLDVGTIAFFHTFRTLVILLQVDFVFSDELETVRESCYGIKDTSIFAWSSIPDVGHYRWLRDPIRRLPLNSKADYLVHTI
jgi:hypothetical protein